MVANCKLLLSSSTRDKVGVWVAGGDPAKGRRLWAGPVADRGELRRKIAPVEQADLGAAVDACRSLIRDRFPDDDHRGAAAMLLDDGTILTGTSPDAVNSSVEVCHETEPYCAAFRLGRHIVASVCLHREPGGRTVVLSPCGVCRERLAVHGPNVLVAVADVGNPTLVVWKRLKEVFPYYTMTAFPDEIDAGWTD